MLTQTTKVILSISLSILSTILFLIYKNKERKLCMFAMLSSTVGDVFMTDMVNVGSMSTYFGAFFFILAHIIYAYCFIKRSKEKEYKFVNFGFYLGLVLMMLMIITLTILMFSKTKKIQPMYFPLLAYIFFIGVNTISQYSYAFNEKGLRKMLMIGMLLFVISDFLVFLPMLNICKESPTYNDYIWFTYVPAQLLILLFNSK